MTNSAQNADECESTTYLSYPYWLPKIHVIAACPGSFSSTACGSIPKSQDLTSPVIVNALTVADEIELRPISSGEETSADNSPTAEDGGKTGWMVVAGASTMFFVTLGLVYSFGVMQDELVNRGVASSSTLGWVSSVTVVQNSLLSFPCNSVVRRFGNRRAGFIGALLVGTGYLSTSWTFHSVPALFIAQGIFGLGYAFIFWASNSIAAQYFTRRRALAVGIVYSGSGLGGAVMSIILSNINKTLGLEMGVRILGIIAYVTLIPASFTLKAKHRPARTTFVP